MITMSTPRDRNVNAEVSSGESSPGTRPKPVARQRAEARDPTTCMTEVIHVSVVSQVAEPAATQIATRTSATSMRSDSSDVRPDTTQHMHALVGAWCWLCVASLGHDGVEIIG